MVGGGLVLGAVDGASLALVAVPLVLGVRCRARSLSKSCSPACPLRASIRPPPPVRWSTSLTLGCPDPVIMALRLRKALPIRVSSRPPTVLRLLTPTPI